MDCSIIPTRFPDIYQVSTTDFFFPLVEDPYIQGKIAAANVLSDLYALGMQHCDNLLCLAGACSQMSPKDRDIVLAQMLRGFNDVAKTAGTRVTGGQTVINAWPLIGGVAIVAAKEEDFIRPESAVAGDVLVLTKPLGTQVAVNLNEWLASKNISERWKKVEGQITEEEVVQAYHIAMLSMSRLNKTAAQLMHKYKAHAATDVTGFGLLGHANNLAYHQKAKVDLVIEVLPIIKRMDEVDRHLNGMFSLVRGFSAETSGGLLVCLPSLDAAEAFCKDILEMDGQPAWIIGRVVEGDNKASIVASPTIIHV
jgi:selenide,water dikinase